MSGIFASEVSNAMSGLKIVVACRSGASGNDGTPGSDVDDGVAETPSKRHAARGKREKNALLFAIRASPVNLRLTSPGI